MRRVLAFVFTLLLATISQARAQVDLAPQSQAIVDRIEAELAAAGDEAQGAYDAFEALSPDFEAAAALDAQLPLLFAATEAQLASGVQLHYLEQGLLWAGDETAANASTESVLYFLDTATYAPQAAPFTRNQLYELGEALDRLNAAGMSLSELEGKTSPVGLQLIEDALKVFKAGLSAAELAEGDKPERDRIVRDFVDLVPSNLAPALNGPAGAAFADLMEWNGQMWDASTAGIDLVADAISRGHLDQERYGAIAATLEKLAAKGPWGSDTAREFLKKWAENLPGVGKLIKALWPEPTPEECRAINCDCDNLDFGILTGAYREECRAAEAALLKQCIDTHAIAGSCHPTASGPAASPMN